LPENVIDYEQPIGGYTDEDYSSALWGYGQPTGTAERPGMDVSTESARATSDLPPIDQDKPQPGGNDFREQGTPIDGIAKLGYKEETVSEGWLNKAVGGVIDAQTSAPEQYEMQTSMTQRDKVREGSQNPNTGTASEYMAPIGSWRPTWGIREKPWSGGRRHYDMTPRVADMIIRPFLNRRAGTGDVGWMNANEATQYQRSPLQRQPVPDPYAGVPIIGSGNVYEEESADVSNWVNVWY